MDLFGLDIWLKIPNSSILKVTLLYLLGVSEMTVNCLPGGSWDNDYIPSCQVIIKFCWALWDKEASQHLTCSNPMSMSEALQRYRLFMHAKSNKGGKRCDRPIIRETTGSWDNNAMGSNPTVCYVGSPLVFPQQTGSSTHSPKLEVLLSRLTTSLDKHTAVLEDTVREMINCNTY